MRHLRVESGCQICGESTGRQNQDEDEVVKSQYESSNQTGHRAYNLLLLLHSPLGQADKNNTIQIHNVRCNVTVPGWLNSSPLQTPFYQE